MKDKQASDYVIDIDKSMDSLWNRYKGIDVDCILKYLCN
jgi:hypothetical protein